MTEKVFETIIKDWHKPSWSNFIHRVAVAKVQSIGESGKVVKTYYQLVEYVNDGGEVFRSEVPERFIRFGFFKKHYANYFARNGFPESLIDSCR